MLPAYLVDQSVSIVVMAVDRGNDVYFIQMIHKDAHLPWYEQNPTLIP